MNTCALITASFFMLSITQWNATIIIVNIYPI